MDDRAERIARALGGGAQARLFRAPGRVNLMGDHTDYNEGFVLPMAIDRDCLVAVRPRSDGRIGFRSLDLQPEEAAVEVAADGGDEPASVEPAWGRYVAGVVRVLAERGRPPVGAEAVLSSSVPRGSGLASSAALEVACALALVAVAGFELPARELAAACREAEHVATGVPCGIMDQLVALEGRAGAALLLDCRSLELEPVPLPPGVAVLAVHSGLPRALAGSAYAERRAACERAAARLGVRALRDARPADAAGEAYARHVVSENARVLDTAAAIRAGDLDALGPLFAASHASLRDDYRVSTPELDALVEALVEAGALAARLTGAGFGGCVVALAHDEDADGVASTATRRYREATGLAPTVYPCRAVDGAGPVRLGTA
ncbi:MAG TPA: galactokinase [Gaiellaceae bacterium]|nr:galactokinase [Gaiellaceae bacterium]